MRQKADGFFLRGDVEAAFKYARWAPTVAFVLVFLSNGDFTYMTCGLALAVWPVFKLKQPK